VPLGGGKDSIVVLESLARAGREGLSWLYVGDGLEEFDDSERLQDVVRLSGVPVWMVDCPHVMQI
jgi:hypothetical protein